MSNLKFRKHIQKLDAKFYEAISDIKGLKSLKPKKKKDPFEGLCAIIVGQQLSTTAAISIWNRFRKGFRGVLTPRKILNRSEDKLREFGISNNKAKALRALSRGVVSKEVDFDKLAKCSDEEISENLQKIKGIGPWTSEMFLMFCFARPDRTSFGDLALRKAIKGIYKMKELPNEKQFKRITNRWAPYRTYACLALWAWLDPKDPWDEKL